MSFQRDTIPLCHCLYNYINPLWIRSDPVTLTEVLLTIGPRLKISYLLVIGLFLSPNPPILSVRSCTCLCRRYTFFNDNKVSTTLQLQLSPSSPSTYTSPSILSPVFAERYGTILDLS